MGVILIEDRGLRGEEELNIDKITCKLRSWKKDNRTDLFLFKKWLEDDPEPEVGPMDVLIKINKTSICGTDIHIWNWDKWAQKTIPVGMTVGHEYSGTIVALGSGITDFSVGERVSGEGHIVCGHCRNCLAGRRHLCPNTEGVGVNRTGAFAEYLSLPAKNAYKVDSSIPEDIISTFALLGLTYSSNGAKVSLLGIFPIFPDDVAIDWDKVIFKGLILTLLC